MSAPTLPDRLVIEAFFRDLQDDICRQLEAADPGHHFRHDNWERSGGGGGQTRLLSGQRIEKGGVNFSAVYGELSPAAAQSLHVGAARQFYASGVSIVLHPRNPHVPIIHMNVRYFETDGGRWWFGGGIDLTPHYVVPSTAAWFHRQLQAVCDAHHPDYYARFKAWADSYFFLPHRQETRGVGGIFFDRLAEDEPLSRAELFGFVQAVGRAFAPIYVSLLGELADQPYSEAELAWQRLRRGRYVEFNLVWDRGTQFGLQTGGRTESILMSLPPRADWTYDYQPLTDSAEAATLNWLRSGVDWVGNA